MSNRFLVSLNRGLNVSWPHFVLFTVYISYILLGGGIFQLLEGGRNAEFRDNISQYKELKVELDTAIRNLGKGVQVTVGNLTSLWEEYTSFVDESCNLRTRVDWTYTGSVLFCVTTIATIGYGDAVPVTPVGQAVVVIYSLVGIPLTLTFLADIGGLLARVVIFIVAKLQCRGTKESRTSTVEDIEKVKPGDSVDPPQRDRPSTRSPLNEDGNLRDLRMSLGIFQDSSARVSGSRSNSRRNSIDAHQTEQERAGSTTAPESMNLGYISNSGRHPGEETKNEHGSMGDAGTNQETGETTEAEHGKEVNDDTDGMQRQVSVVLVMVILLVYTLVGALMISKVEEWDYGDALYFTFITLTTIGFGDFVPIKHYMDIPSFFGCLLYTICGLSVMSMCLALVQAKVIKLMSRVAAQVGF